MWAVSGFLTCNLLRRISIEDGKRLTSFKASTWKSDSSLTLLIKEKGSWTFRPRQVMSIRTRHTNELYLASGLSLALLSAGSLKLVLENLGLVTDSFD